MYYNVKNVSSITQKVPKLVDCLLVDSCSGRDGLHVLFEKGLLIVWGWVARSTFDALPRKEFELQMSSTQCHLRLLVDQFRSSMWLLMLCDFQHHVQRFPKEGSAVAAVIYGFVYLI